VLCGHTSLHDSWLCSASMARVSQVTSFAMLLLLIVGTWNVLQVRNIEITFCDYQNVSHVYDNVPLPESFKVNCRIHKTQRLSPVLVQSSSSVLHLLFSHLGVIFSNGLSLSGFQTKILYVFVTQSVRVTHSSNIGLCLGCNNNNNNNNNRIITIIRPVIWRIHIMNLLDV
jgi:hypothetical protein